LVSAIRRSAAQLTIAQTCIESQEGQHHPTSGYQTQVIKESNSHSLRTCFVKPISTQRPVTDIQSVAHVPKIEPTSADRDRGVVLLFAAVHGDKRVLSWLSCASDPLSFCHYVAVFTF
jgi:hypothetical protein